MHQPPPGWQTVWQTKQRRECMELRLVLEAAGIAAKSAQRGGRWSLAVPEEQFEIAAAEVEAYQQENMDRSTTTPSWIPTYQGAGTAVLVYVTIIVIMAVLTARNGFGFDWLTAGEMQSGEVMSGQWWRTVTALTLHLDFGHVAGNLVFGVTFGLLAGRVLGGGVAWLGIVLAGALGNFINAMVQAANHTSIGASTAVFAALGIIVAHALRPRHPQPEDRLRKWRPLIGGLLLLAFTGVGGERTDVAAHVTGFSAGLLIGAAGCRLPVNWLASNKVQVTAGLSSVVIVALAWYVGLRASG